MVYDITVPTEASFVTHVPNRDYSVSVEATLDDGANPADAVAAARRPRPEGMAFHPRSRLQTRTPVLAVANEVSGTTALFAIERLTGRR